MTPLLRMFWTFFEFGKNWKFDNLPPPFGHNLKIKVGKILKVNRGYVIHMNNPLPEYKVIISLLPPNIIDIHSLVIFMRNSNYYNRYLRAKVCLEK